MNNSLYIDSRCKVMINGLEEKLATEIKFLKITDVSSFILQLFRFRIYCDLPDVKPMIREERAWLRNKTIHCLVLHKLLDWIDPQFRNLTLNTLIKNVKEDKAGPQPPAAEVASISNDTYGLNRTSMSISTKTGEEDQSNINNVEGNSAEDINVEGGNNNEEGDKETKSNSNSVV